MSGSRLGDLSGLISVGTVIMKVVQDARRAGSEVI
jgi:hypothetical protein